MKKIERYIGWLWVGGGLAASSCVVVFLLVALSVLIAPGWMSASADGISIGDVRIKSLGSALRSYDVSYVEFVHSEKERVLKVRHKGSGRLMGVLVEYSSDFENYAAETKCFYSFFVKFDGSGEVDFHAFPAKSHCQLSDFVYDEIERVVLASLTKLELDELLIKEKAVE